MLQHCLTPCLFLTHFLQGEPAAVEQAAAHIQEVVGEEEVSHVQFATHWFQEWTGSVDFEQWRSVLPAELRPLGVRGKKMHRSRRLQANYPEEFLNHLEGWTQ